MIQGVICDNTPLLGVVVVRKEGGANRASGSTRCIGIIGNIMTRGDTIEVLIINNILRVVVLRYIFL